LEWGSVQWLCYRQDSQGFKSQQGKEFVSPVSTLGLGPTQPPTQRAPGFFPGS